MKPNATANSPNMDVHPYPQDITADPFLVFGGLFSRKVIQRTLQTLEPSSPKFFHDLLRLADQCRAESALQQGFEDSCNRHGIRCTKIDSAPTCDRLIGKRYVVEIKLDKHNNDPQFWPGSREDENSVLQTRRYLNESKERDWGLLTNGKVFRLMHKTQELNFIDLWACDAVPSGPNVQMTFMFKALREPEFLDTLLHESAEERLRFTNTFAKGVQNFWSRYQKNDNKRWNVALVEAVLCVAFHRYLEDVGILPVIDEAYHEHSLLQPVTVERLLANLGTLRTQRFLTSEKVEPATSILSDETLTRVREVLATKGIFKEFCALFWDNKGAIDLSDLKVSFFGDAYQLFANKTDINGVDGQYFTGSELARETANYFVEDEKRGIAADEIIYDPFVGSGQLLRALVPYFHLLLQGEVLEPSIVAGMRRLVLRLAGTDIDANACWLARLSLTLVTAEKDKPLVDLTNQIIHADVFESCFGHTESRWQPNLGIQGKIRGIITNPPWRRLRQTSNELYSIETGAVAPLRANQDNWASYQKWLKNGGRDRAATKGNALKKLAALHRETFSRAGQREVNVAVSALDFVDRLPGAAGKKWVAFMPDCFFVGQNSLRAQKTFNVRRYYSYPYNDHFEGTDGVMKFGVVFGGGSRQKQVFCHPMGKGRVDVTSVVSRLNVLPIFGSVEEAIAQNVWFSKSITSKDWHRGEFDETEEPKRGAVPASKGGTAVRGAKDCNDKKTRSCLFNESSVSRWRNWNSAHIGNMVIVRDNRSNTRKGKVLWAGLHLPGQNGIPKDCAISNAWNYLRLNESEARAYQHVLNSPLADTAIRSIGSKRHINPKDLCKLGLPVLPAQVISLLADPKINFVEANALICAEVFKLSKLEAARLLTACDWLSKSERTKIVNLMSGDAATAASKLAAALPGENRQFKKAVKKMARR